MESTEHKWQALSQAFSNMGNYFADACENMDVTTGEYKKFDELYIVFVALLETMKAVRQVINNRLDEIGRAEDYSLASFSRS